MSNFAIIGMGYIAPRHLKAIYDTGNKVTAVVDPHDSVGILDKYDYDIKYFSEIERFDRYLYKHPVDYVSICSPNYLHDAHCRLALRNGAYAICEKPVVINPWNLDTLQEMELQYHRIIYPVMQMRYHPILINLHTIINPNTYYDGDLTYHTPRGEWFYRSWKSNEEKSGGLLINIGVHMFDILIWLFGTPRDAYSVVTDDCISKGVIHFPNARIIWELSTMIKDMKRNLSVNGEYIDFSDVISFDLHTKTYEEILAGRGLALEDARPSIELIRSIKDDSIR